MKELKDIAKVTLSTLGVFIVIVVGLYLGANAYNTPTKYFAEHFTLNVPNKVKILEHEKERGFTGDGVTFLLIKPKNVNVTRGTDLDPKYFTSSKLNEKEKEIVAKIKESLKIKFNVRDDTPVLKRTFRVYPDMAIIIYNKDEQTYAIYQFLT